MTNNFSGIQNRIISRATCSGKSLEGIKQKAVELPCMC